jgi:NTE family protein
LKIKPIIQIRLYFFVLPQPFFKRNKASILRFVNDGIINYMAKKEGKDSYKEQTSDRAKGAQKEQLSESDQIKKQQIALVLQGGGALGAYHIGAYQALQEAGLEPDWISGISIGAINASIIAGSRPEERLDKLNQLWMDISRPDVFGEMLQGQALRMSNQVSAATSILFGQPNFWFTRFPSPVFFSEIPTEYASYCDTAPMLETLKRLVDFNLLNKGAIRLSLGATKVNTGELVFFDNTRDKIGPQHILASGSLPPGFPATRVDNELYWDGGCVSNTPLDAIYEDHTRDNILVFMIDLWGALGEPPMNMDEVNWRQKQIQYASRTSHSIHTWATQHNLTRKLMRMGQLPETKKIFNLTEVPDEILKRSEKNVDIVQVIYHPASDQISLSDTEFSRSSIRARTDAGFQDMIFALKNKPWERYANKEKYATVLHKVHRGKIQSFDFPSMHIKL